MGAIFMYTYIKEKMNMKTEYDMIIAVLIIVAIYQQKQINRLSKRLESIDKKISIIEHKTETLERKMNYYEETISYYINPIKSVIMKIYVLLGYMLTIYVNIKRMIMRKVRGY